MLKNFNITLCVILFLFFFNIGFSKENFFLGAAKKFAICQLKKKGCTSHHPKPVFGLDRNRKKRQACFKRIPECN